MATGIDDNVSIGGESKEVTPVVIATLDENGKAQIGAVKTPVATVHIASGLIAAGKQSVTLIPSVDFAGTILGAELDIERLSFDARDGEVLSAIPFTITSGSITSITI
jgi:hypothetical protein